MKEIYKTTWLFLKTGHWMVPLIDLSKIHKEDRVMESILWFCLGVVIGVLFMMWVIR